MWFLDGFTTYYVKIVIRFNLQNPTVSGLKRILMPNNNCIRYEPGIVTSVPYHIPYNG